jgi:hypothetical protein
MQYANHKATRYAISPLFLTLPSPSSQYSPQHPVLRPSYLLFLFYVRWETDFYCPLQKKLLKILDFGLCVLIFTFLAQSNNKRCLK